MKPQMSLKLYFLVELTTTCECVTSRNGKKVNTFDTLLVLPFLTLNKSI